MKTYTPQPIDTSHVVLPTDVLELREKLALNNHEAWAAQRIAQGWTCGPRRNDALREHPCLVPYDDLLDVEKDYDRSTATETLKLIVALGYRISKN